MTSTPTIDPLLALRAGDPSPFEDFVRAWTRKLVAFFHHQGTSLGRAEDLTQEVFLRLYQSARVYEPRERFAAYCYRTARNLWIDECRRTAARSDGVHSWGDGRARDEAAASHLDPGRALLFAEEERGLRELLDELPPGQRRVFELVLLFELSYAEIGAHLSIPVGTVKSRMFHAVRRLRGAWEAKLQREGVA
jgi:RNA polymerase sigma-70 factor (ECF subfamily)